VSEPMKLSTAGLYRAVRTFEEAYERKTGERVPSGVMYARYRDGAIDESFTTLWMTFYEALERRAATEGEDSAAVLEQTLEPLLAR
jgi:hypothetical protein